MPIRALLLDAGGTLLTEEPAREVIYADHARARGLEVSPARMKECMGRAHAALPQVLDGHFRYSLPWFERFIDHIFAGQLGLPAGEVPALRRELFAAFADPRSFRLLPGAALLLEQASARGLPMALVSNWSPAMEGVLDGLGVSRHFSTRLISALEGVEKPDPEIFRRALARLNVPAAQALHVGNEPVQDVLGASACGIRTLLFDPHDRHRDLPHPRIGALREVIPWIESQP
ncbi:MAG: HAD family hydrolase [Planctomycetes bacterium]|nr:HAD family hydrolase [Planctomycetota bacterium]